MLRSLKHLKNYGLDATDGEIGSVDDFYFDDKQWMMRYLVLKTQWLGRQVLIAPKALGKPDWEHKTIATNLTKNQVEKSPDIKSRKVVTREEEERIGQYYNWSPYWSEKSGSNLQSVNQILGFNIVARDENVGHVDDFIIEDSNWRIPYLVVDTGDWLSGKKVLLSLDWIRDIEHAGKKVHVDLLKKQIEKVPAFNPDNTIDRRYEEVLYDAYGKPKYWQKE